MKQTGIKVGNTPKTPDGVVDHPEEFLTPYIFIVEEFTHVHKLNKFCWCPIYTESAFDYEDASEIWEKANKMFSGPDRTLRVRRIGIAPQRGQHIVFHTDESQQYKD